MAYFYRDGRLKLGTPQACADVEELARAQGRPCYIYDLDDISHRLGLLESALSGTRLSVHFAMKSNSHTAILKRLASLGAGADTVSAGEIRLCVEAGIPADRIIFSGVAKTARELEYAISLGIKQINVESPGELQRIAQIAARLNRTVNVAFRMNPDVNPKTHPYITTGFRENKFGMDESFIPELLSILEVAGTRLRLRGLTMHIGSQIFELDVLQEALEKTITVHRSLEAKGYQLDRLDIGGGIGIDYATDATPAEFEFIAAYGKMVRDTIERSLGHLDIEVLTEPGRILVARAGLLVGEVQYIKSAPAKTFAILDTGMHHLMRPALYGAKHRVLELRKKPGSQVRYDIVGPICESADCLAKDVELSELVQGDYVGIADAGAYGFSMASHYNAHELPIEIAVSDGQVVEK